MTKRKTTTANDWADQYHRPEWQKKRLEVLEAAGWKCEACGAKDAELHVHHKCYVSGRAPWEYGHREMVVLCGKHHEEWHMAQRALLLSMTPSLLWILFQLIEIQGCREPLFEAVLAAIEDGQRGDKVVRQMCRLLKVAKTDGADEERDRISQQTFHIAQQSPDYAKCRKYCQTVEDACGFSGGLF